MIWNKKNQFKPGKRKRIEYYLMITQPPSLMRKGIFSKLLIKYYKFMAKKRGNKKKNCTNRKSENSKNEKKKKSAKFSTVFIVC